jgi:hypothetical protein
VRTGTRIPVRAVRRYLALSAAERWLLMRAMVALAAVDLRLRVHGFRRLIESTEQKPRPVARRITDRDMLHAREYARWIEFASRHHLVRARCLHRSLALHRWLMQDGLPSDLRIGVRKVDGELQAHAWVELAGNAVSDQLAAIAAYIPLARADGRHPDWASTTNSSRAREWVGIDSERTESQ